MLVLALFILLLGASLFTLDLQLAALFSADGLAKLAEFGRGFAPPDLSPAFLTRVAQGGFETLAMSALGSLLAAGFGLLLALPASRTSTPWLRRGARLILNVLRSIPELVWAALLVIAAGLGPFPGTLALAVHTSGVLGRLFADTLENLPPAPADALRTNGATPVAVFLYATLPQAAPQFLSTRFIAGRTTSAPRRCSAWSAPAGWGSCFTCTSAGSRCSRSPPSCWRCCFWWRSSMRSATSRDSA